MSTMEALAQPQQHPEKDAIIRQVEYYFGDENLPKDAHLLALAGGDPNGKVEVKKILSFSKMRRFKPKTLVIATLRESDLVEIVDDKYIRRRTPLNVPLQVEPSLSIDNRARILAEKPWMTKALLKPTGFESNHVDGPVSVDDYNVERELYSSENSFISRIEEAVNRFCRNRKMHQTTRNIFVKFMRFGGVSGGQGQFGSGANRKQLKKEGLEQDEIDRVTAYFSVDNAVLESFDEKDADAGEWYVDFAALAKGFLSAHFTSNFPWDDEELIITTCNVLRNFYNYLLLHDVCPEYRHQLLDARVVCDLAEDELPKLIEIGKLLPGEFAIACSTLFEGSYAGVHRDDDAGWHDSSEKANVGLSQKEAEEVFRAGIPSGAGSVDDLKVVWERNIGLEVVKAVNEKLVCKPWELPFDHSVPEEPVDPTQEFEFLIGKPTVDKCFPGLKLDVIVKKLSNGLHWIDYVYAAHPSFFTWLGNEEIKKRRASNWSGHGRETDGAPDEDEELSD